MKMALVNEFVAPTATAKIIKKSDNLQLLLTFNYPLSLELESEINELESYGYDVRKYTLKFWQIKAPEKNLRAVVAALNSKHGIKVNLCVMEAGNPPIILEEKTLEPASAN
jgi:hypothetical protein